MSGKLFPRQQMPDLSVLTLSGGAWVLKESRPQNFTMIVFYRGYHCPICKGYLSELNRLVDNFAQEGVASVAISSDGPARAKAAVEEWSLDKLAVGYGLSLAKARSLGLFISSSIGKTSVGIEEPDEFSEPGIMLVRPDNTLYWSQIQTMPFARPRFEEILGAVNKVLSLNYPARGEVA